MTKKRIISAIVGVAVFFGFWQLFDFLFATYIDRSEFKFEIGSNLIMPLLCGALIFLILIPMYDKDMDKSRAKYEGLHEKRHHKAPEDQNKE